jgi:hypothetical protein
MGEASAVMIAFVIDENLGLVLEAAESRGVDDAVAIALKRRARWAFGLGHEAAAAFPGLGSIWSEVQAQCRFLCQ